ncbi:hypothetical protein M406DRAFT_231988, partial [Cryphonectria parasitica EP155]
MAVQSKPIPALYVVYVLRSTVRHGSIYIGSTPNPPRRLNQHNGLAKGGAVRTAKKNLRPWEMVAVVSGFPSMVGALKFEWALNNPHVSLHIAPEDRLTISTQRKRNNQPRRPPHNLTSVLSNLHLLLRVPSFSRWPLKLHFFDRQVFTKWNKYCSSPDVETLRETIEVGDEDAEDSASEAESEDTTKPAGPSWGIHALPLDHSTLTPYLEKGQDISVFEREGNCVVCHQHLDHDKGIYAICSQMQCEGVGHLDCWSRHLLHQQREDVDSTVLLPVEGRCPKCDGVVRWGDMMRELTLRNRGQKVVDKILKRSRKAAQVKKPK